jgi:hypothetical protein
MLLRRPTTCQRAKRRRSPARIDRESVANSAAADVQARQRTKSRRRPMRRAARIASADHDADQQGAPACDFPRAGAFASDLWAASLSPRAAVEALGGLLDQLGHGLWLRHISGMTAVDLDHRGSGTLGHGALRRWRVDSGQCRTDEGKCRMIGKATGVYQRGIADACVKQD